MATLFFRGLDEWTAQVFKTNAGARGLKHGDYLTSLVLLHQATKEKARDNPDVEEMLEGLGLTEIVA